MTTDPAEPIRYHVDLGDRERHLVHVRMHVPADLAAGARVAFAAWTPGSYVVRDYARHVQRIEALDPDGAPVPLRPDGHAVWIAPADLDSALELRVELYANELTVRTNHVDARHALLVGAATFPFVDDGRDRRHVVTFAARDRPRVHALLPVDEQGAFVADDLDHLYDAAFEVGDFEVAPYDVAGSPHRIVWTLDGGPVELDRLAEDAASIGEAAVRTLGGDLPVEDYTFLVVGWEDGGGGLEHRDGAVLQAPVRAFQKPETYRRVQQLIAHEYLHLWNVKRMTPRALVRPDFERPTHTPSLWVAEGWTAFYDRLLPLRAALWTTEQFLASWSETIHAVLQRPGARLQSVRDASREAWIKQYRPNENSVNVGVDYYAHGSVLALCLDLALRRSQPEGDGLDDVLRLLWKRFGPDGQAGYDEQDIEDAVSEVAGDDLDRFFDRYVAAPSLPPVEELLGIVGVGFGAAEEEPLPWLGVQSRAGEVGEHLSAVLRDGPAWDAGVTGGDEVVAIDGVRVRPGELAVALRGHEAGDRIELALFRGHRLLDVEVVLDAPQPRRPLVRLEDADERQRAQFERWVWADAIMGERP